MENICNTVKPVWLISQITRRIIPWYGSAKSVKYRDKSTCVHTYITYNTHLLHLPEWSVYVWRHISVYIVFFLILRITVLSTLIITLQAVTCVILRSYIIFYYLFLYTLSPIIVLLLWMCMSEPNEQICVIENVYIFCDLKIGFYVNSTSFSAILFEYSSIKK